MKPQIPQEDWKTWVLPPPISYKADPTLGKTPTDKSDSIKVDIKTQHGESDSNMVEIFVPLFRTGIT